MKTVFNSEVGDIRVDYFSAGRSFRLMVSGKPLAHLEFEREVKESEERPIAESMVKMYTSLVFIEAKEKRSQ